MVCAIYKTISVLIFTSSVLLLSLLSLSFPLLSLSKSKMWYYCLLCSPLTILHCLSVFLNAKTLFYRLQFSSFREKHMGFLRYINYPVYFADHLVGHHPLFFLNKRFLLLLIKKYARTVTLSSVQVRNLVLFINICTKFYVNVSFFYYRLTSHFFISP